MPNVLSCLRKESIARWRSDRFPKPLSNDEHCCDLPTPDKRQKRHCQQVDCIAYPHQEPIPLRPIGKPSACDAQTISDKLSCTRYHTDSDCTSAKHRQVGTNDAPRRFVGNVCEQTHNAEEDDALVCTPLVLHVGGRRSVRTGEIIQHLVAAKRCNFGQWSNTSASLAQYDR